MGGHQSLFPDRVSVSLLALTQPWARPRHNQRLLPTSEGYFGSARSARAFFLERSQQKRRSLCVLHPPNLGDRMNRFAALILLPICVGCSQTVPDARPNQSADSTALNDLRVREAAAAKRGDLDGVMATLTSDVVIMPPNAAAVVGADSVRPWLAPVLAQFDYDVRYVSRDLVIAGDWAIDRGDYTLALTPRVGGDPTTESGKYLWAVRRDADGAWRYWRSIWSSNAPPTVR